MDIEYWTPEDFVDGHCTAADIGKEKPLLFEDVAVNEQPAHAAAHDPESPRRRGRPPNTEARARSVQESLRMAFHGLGGADGLMKWGRSNPTEFYRLCGRLVPQEIKAALDVHHVTITHALAPTALDVHPNKDGVYVAPPMADAEPPIHRISTQGGEADKLQ